ncbi:MAG: kinase, partial [bacterium]
ANSPGIDLEKLSDKAAYKKLDQLTEAILSGQLLELVRFAHTGRHLNDPHLNQLFQVWPLQIVFSKIGWYLGYETKGGTADKLFRFERLDRFSINQILPEKRDIKEQKAALSKLEKLYQS